MAKIKSLIAVFSVGILIVACAQTYVVRNGVEQSCKHRSFTKIWSKPLGSIDYLNTLNANVLLDSDAIVWSLEFIMSLDIDTGKLLWRIDLLGTRIYNVTPLAKNRLLAGTYSGKLYLIDKDSGKYKVIDTNIEKMNVVSCNPDGQSVLLTGLDQGKGDYFIASYDLEQNKKLWSIKLDSFPIKNVITVGDFIGIATFNFGNRDCVKVIDRKEETIKYTVRPKYDRYSICKIDNNRMLIFSSGKIGRKRGEARQILDLRDGSLKEQSSSGTYDSDTAVVAGNILYNVSSSHVVARDLYSGKKRWESPSIYVEVGDFYYSILHRTESYIVVDIYGYLIVCDINTGRILYNGGYIGRSYSASGNDLLIVDSDNKRIELLTRCSKKQ